MLPLGLLLLPVAASRAAPPPPYDLHLAVLQPAGYSPSPTGGLQKLAWELRRRTSLAIDLQVVHVDPASPRLFEQPQVFWHGDGAFLPLSPAAVANLRHYLQAGGSLWLDAADGRRAGPFYRGARAQLQALLAELPQPQGVPVSLAPLPLDHVMLRAFYLMPRSGTQRPELQGASVDGRLAVVVDRDDLAGSLARDAFGAWQVEVAAQGMDRETHLRLAINALFYALCLDYKDDQVHLPFLLKRRH